MAEFKRISFLILMLAVALCSAVPPRNRQLSTASKKIQHLKQRPVVIQKRVSARQEAVTPYPSADELKPEVPFEEGHTPDEVYGPPDESYGPPEGDQTPADQLPSEEAPEEFAPNSDAEDFHTEEKILSPLKAHILRLTRRKLNKKILSARLLDKKKKRLIGTRVKTIALPATYLFSNQPLTYTATHHAW